MKNIKILDCTLRDGGHVNNWNFGEDRILSIITNLVKQNENLSELMIQHTEAFAHLQKKFNRLLKEHNDIKIKLALRCD